MAAAPSLNRIVVASTADFDATLAATVGAPSSGAVFVLFTGAADASGKSW
jgi:hypothetical protein